MPGGPEAGEQAEAEAAIHTAAGISAILLCGNLRRSAALQVLWPPLRPRPPHTRPGGPPSADFGSQKACDGDPLQGTHPRPSLRGSAEHQL